MVTWVTAFLLDRFLVCIRVLVVLPWRLLGAAPMPTADEVYAVRYATLANFPVSSLIAGADRARRLDIAMMIWVLKGVDGRVAIVDSGFHRDQHTQAIHGQGFRQAVRRHRAAGTRARSGHRHLPVTHALGPCRRHRSVPAARVWIQKEEYDYYTSDAWQARTTHGGIDADDVLEIVKRNIAGKVSFVRGDDDTILSGITFGIGGKHTWQSQFVAVQTRAHTVVLASDNMYLYENLDTHTADLADARRGVQSAHAGSDEEPRQHAGAAHPRPRSGGVRSLPARQRSDRQDRVDTLGTSKVAQGLQPCGPQPEGLRHI
mgnify:CR=1 FL=1